MAYFQLIDKLLNKMTKLLDIIYYQAFLFYSKRLIGDDPHFTTTWGVGIAFAFILLFSVLPIKNIFICDEIKTIYLFGISLLIYGAFHYYFTKNSRREKIVKEKPLYKGSVIYSRVIAILYFGFAISMMFIGPLLSRHFYLIYCE